MVHKSVASVASPMPRPKFQLVVCLDGRYADFATVSNERGPGHTVRESATTRMYRHLSIEDYPAEFSEGS